MFLRFEVVFNVNQITCCSNQVVPGGTHNFTPGKQGGPLRASYRCVGVRWGAMGCGGVGDNEIDRQFQRVCFRVRQSMTKQ